MNQTMEFLHFKLVSKQLKRLVQKVLELCTATEYPSLKIMSGIFENLQRHNGVKSLISLHFNLCPSTIYKIINDYLLVNTHRSQRLRRK